MVISNEHNSVELLEATRKQVEDNNLSRQSTPPLELAVTLANALARIFDIDLTYTNQIVHGLALTHALNRIRTLVRTLASALGQTPRRDLSHALAHNLALAKNLEHALDTILASSFEHPTNSSFIALLIISQLITKQIVFLLQTQTSPTTETLQPTENLHLVLTDSQSPIGGFLPDYLATAVLPYISALIQIHHVIDEIHGRSPADIKILGIRYGSVSVDLTGGIRDTVELLLDTVVSWRRENKKKLADLELAEKETELRKKKVEVEQARAALPREAKQAEEAAERTAAETLKLEAEAQKVEAEARLLNEQAQKQQLDNQKIQLEIMQLTLEMITRIAPDLPEEKRLLYAIKMVDPVRLIATSPLEIVEAKMVADEKGSPAEAEASDKPESEPTDK